MCLLNKVAHQRESGEYVRFPPVVGDAGSQQQQQEDEDDDCYSQEIQSQLSQFRQQNQSAVMMQQQQQQQHRTNQQQQAAAAEMFYGSHHQSQATEMSAMVSALTHVVSGQQRAADWGCGSNLAAMVSSTHSGSDHNPSAAVYSPPPSSSASPSGSGSGIWNIGQKRGREEEGSTTNTQFIESLPRVVQRSAFPDFRASHADLSSGATTTGMYFQSILILYSIFFNIN